MVDSRGQSGSFWQWVEIVVAVGVLVILLVILGRSAWPQLSRFWDSVFGPSPSAVPVLFTIFSRLRSVNLGGARRGALSQEAFVTIILVVIAILVALVLFGGKLFGAVEPFFGP